MPGSKITATAHREKWLPTHSTHKSAASQTSATPATQSEGRCRKARHQSQSSAISATPATLRDGRCHQVPRLPRKVKVDVTERHACHANSRDDQSTQARHQSQSSAISAPTTQSDGRCHQAPRLPRKCPSAPPEPVQCHKRHACHTKKRSMSASATPATQSEGRCHRAPRLPRKQPRRPKHPSAPPEPVQCHKCAYHAK